MKHPDPRYTYNEDGDLVSIWVGNFESNEAAEAYMREDYGDDSDAEDDYEDGDDCEDDEVLEDRRPISEFAADIGLISYDEDWRELNFKEGLSDKGRDALVGHSWWESYYLPAWDAIEKQNLTCFNTIITMFFYDHAMSPLAKRSPQRVHFVGTFPMVPKHSEWFEEFMKSWDQTKGTGDNPRSLMIMCLFVTNVARKQLRTTGSARA